jgi:hypothetical protein
MEFVASQANKVDYMVRCIWITCQVHCVMQEFVEGGLKYNLAILTAIVFLTKQTGGDVFSRVGGQIKMLIDMIAMLKRLVVVVTMAAKEASQTAKKANTRAMTANTNANVAKNVVNSIYSKHSTLK